MTEINRLLLQLINEEKTNDEICKTLKISKKQLKRRIESLKFEGYGIKRKYNSDATQGYFIYHGKSNINNSVISIDKIQTNKFKTMIISDTHIGHEYANMDYVKRIYDYCSKNDIHIILHCGDLFEGSINPSMSLENQIEFFLEDYPSDSTFLTFVSAGNHDISFQRKLGLNLKNVIEHKRDDVIILEDAFSTFHFLNNKLFISHKNQYPSGTNGLKIGGHKHFYDFRFDTINPIITVPTLSDLLIKNDYPGAVELDLKLNGTGCHTITLKHLIINENKEIKEISTLDCPFPNDYSVKQKRKRSLNAKTF